MTKLQKQQIHLLRGQGRSYAKIAVALNISENTVKSYCKRNNLGGRLCGSIPVNQELDEFCKQCGNKLIQSPGLKPRKFCSNECRMSWWVSHPEALKQKALYSFSCPQCGATFTAYGNSKRKYCSHSCYINARFGGDKA